MESTLKTKFKTINEYHAAFPKEVRSLLQEMRQTIKEAAPEAEEVISYNMPAFKLNGILVYYAGYKNHIGFYPTSSGIAAFKDKFSNYKWAKGSVQFPIDKPLPVSLITKIVKYRVKENAEKVKSKMKKKK